MWQPGMSGVRRGKVGGALAIASESLTPFDKLLAGQPGPVQSILSWINKLKGNQENCISSGAERKTG